MQHGWHRCGSNGYITSLKYFNAICQASRGEQSIKVVVVGGGISALAAALSASRFAEVQVLCRENPGAGNSALARGGMQVLLGSQEDCAPVIEEILSSFPVRNSEREVRSLMERSEWAFSYLSELGVLWLKSETGQLIRTRAGGQTHQTVAHTERPLGTEIVKALLREIRRRGIEVKSGISIKEVSQLVNGYEILGCDGAGSRTRDSADAVVLAVGGATFDVAQLSGQATTTVKACDADFYSAWAPESSLFPRQFQWHPFSFHTGQVRHLTVPEDLVHAHAQLSIGETELQPGKSRMALHEFLLNHARENSETVLTLSIPTNVIPKALAKQLERSPDAQIIRDQIWSIRVRAAMHYQLDGVRSKWSEGVAAVGEFAQSPFASDRPMGAGVLHAVVSGWDGVEKIVQ